MLTLKGKTYNVPGVYGTTEVIQLGSSSLPVFNGLLLIGDARQGIPASSGKGYEVIKAFGDLSECRNFHLGGDIPNAMAEAQKGGAGIIYTVIPNALTRPAITIKDTSATPLPIFDLKPVLYGASGNDIHISINKVATNLTIEIIPTIKTKFINEDITSATKVLALEDISGLVVGDTIKVEDNGAITNNLSAKIILVDPITNRITIDVDVTSLTKALYGRVFIQNVGAKFSQKFDLTQTSVLTKILTWLNSTNLVEAVRGTNTGDITTIATVENYVGQLTANPATDQGTSPIATNMVDGDYELLIAKLPRLFEEFTNYTKGRIRILNVISPLSALHTSFATLALTLRNLQYPVQIVTGSEVGDINLALSSASHPIKRAQALNSEDVIFCGSGYNGKGAYLTLAPQLAGMMSSTTVKHNLTGDSIVATMVEKTFGEFNKETETSNFINAGVIVAITGKNGFTISQGLNTYQRHETIWNADESKTYLIHQRGIVDFVFEGYRNEMSIGVGADGYTATIAVFKGLSILDKYMSDGFITDRKITNQYTQGNAVVTIPQIIPVEATDFIGYVLQVLVNG